MASAKKLKTQTLKTQAQHAEAERRDDGDRLAALYGLTPKVESAIVAAISVARKTVRGRLSHRFTRLTRLIFWNGCPRRRRQNLSAFWGIASMPRRLPISTKPRVTRLSM